MSSKLRLLARHADDVLLEDLDIFLGQEVVQRHITIFQHGFDISPFDRVFGQCGQLTIVEGVEGVMRGRHDWLKYGIYTVVDAILWTLMMRRLSYNNLGLKDKSLQPLVNTI